MVVPGVDECAYQLHAIVTSAITIADDGRFIAHSLNDPAAARPYVAPR
jgi:hypothetical protein